MGRYVTISRAEINRRISQGRLTKFNHPEDGTKVCARCERRKPIAEFDHNRGTVQSHCKPCRRVYRQEWRKEHPERAHRGDRRNNLAKNYGIRQQEWEALFEKQGRKCAICQSPTTRGRGWHTDHHHDSGAVRGILCHDCNIALGAYETTIKPNLARFEAYWED